MRLINNDCITAMKSMPDNLVDSIVTDPPYELGFMGKSWDSTGIAFNVEVWKEALRVLKPGGHILAFSGSRTYHRMAVAIEDAGFEIRDQIMWVYGSGFPKSHNISKALDKAEGIWRGKAGAVTTDNAAMSGANYERTPLGEPVSAAAAAWNGWGTALKPAHEPIVLARKPFPKGYTVAKNVLEFGTGGLNIDGTRVGGEGGCAGAGARVYGDGLNGTFAKPVEGLGRFPANFIHDGSDEVADLLGEPARFFYCAKTSKRDRNEGLEGFEAKKQDESRKEGNPGGDNPRNRGVSERLNHHPTVKPTDLMRYLCRLVTPPNGIVLDPFMGSGSTGKAAVLEGFEFVGIEQSAEYVEIAQARIDFALIAREQDLLFPTLFSREELLTDAKDESGKAINE